MSQLLFFGNCFFALKVKKVKWFWYHRIEIEFSLKTNWQKYLMNIFIQRII